jgi:hypothetical protein
MDSTDKGSNRELAFAKGASLSFPAKSGRHWPKLLPKRVLFLEDKTLQRRSSLAANGPVEKPPRSLAQRCQSVAGRRAFRATQEDSRSLATGSKKRNRRSSKRARITSAYCRFSRRDRKCVRGAKAGSDSPAFLKLRRIGSRCRRRFVQMGSARAPFAPD